MVNVLQSKPGLSSTTTLHIPKVWSDTWFRGLISNQLKGADVRNAIGTNGISVTGTIASPYATITITGPSTITGPLTINPGAVGTNTLIVNGAANAYAEYLQASAVTNESFGLHILAGTSTSDFGLVVANQNASQNFLVINGVGNATFTTTSTTSPCVTINGAAVSEGLSVVNDITTWRSGATTSGVYYFGSGQVSYLYYTGSGFQLVGTNGSGNSLQIFGGTSASIGCSPHTYGSMTMSSSSSSYAGIQWTAAFGTQGRTLMVSTTAAIQGMYDSNASAWDWYVNSSGTNGIYVAALGSAAAGTTISYSTGGFIEKVTSSARYKLNIKDIDHADADKILTLRPVSYTCNPANTSGDPSVVYHGLIAEEVATVMPNMVAWLPREMPHRVADGTQATHKQDGTPYDTTLIPESVTYDRLVVLLLDVVKRQEARISALEKR